MPKKVGKGAKGMGKMEQLFPLKESLGLALSPDL
jgi:hypothetical protein